MKKFLVGILLLSMPSYCFCSTYIDKQLKETKKNANYNTVNKQIKRDDYTARFSNNIVEVRDPKLIKLTEIVPVDEKDYAKKLSNDETIYEKTIVPALNKKTYTLDAAPQAVDFYKVYRVAERIIRANNLQHMNWRIAIRKTEDINAYASDTNLIVINTGLYDSVYTNEDALAYVIAHEISHNLLGHQQRKVELIKKMEALKAAAKTKFDTTRDDQAYASLAATSGALYYKIKLYKEYRMMEYMADAEGMNLIIKAGYSPDKALYILDFLHSLPEEKKLLFGTHPMSEDRMKSAQENIYYASPMWAEEGKYNIFNSEVLPCKKSSDHVSIVISKDDKILNHYSPETLEQKLTRLAYVSYTKGDMKNAVKYFEKLTEISNDFVPYLYLSYANEYLYKQNKTSSYLKKSIEAIKKAKQINSSDKYVVEQLNELDSL